MTRFSAASAVIMCLAALAVPAAAAVTEITPGDPKGLPESLTVAPDGSVIMGSIAAPVIYRAKPGSATSEIFVDLRAGKGVGTLGVLADSATDTLWACEIVSIDRSTPLLKGVTVLRAFNLQTGAEKGRYPLPGVTNFCNDMVVGPDKAVYVSDTSNAQILRLKPGAAALESVIQDAALFGIDGITFLNGTLYVNTVWSNNLLRIPMDAAGKAGKPVDIYMSQPVAAPDGMRAANGKLFMAEGGAGKVDMVTITGDRATVTTIKSGYTAPTAVQPAGDTLWVADRNGNLVHALPMPK